MRIHSGKAIEAVQFFVILLALAAAPMVAQSQQKQPSADSPPKGTPPRVSRDETLRNYLRNNFAAEMGKVPAYSSTFFDLNRDGKQEAIVYLTEPYWCGTGGCDTLVLSLDGSSYGLITEISISRPPIIALQRTSHGWRNLPVWVQGGGEIQGYEAELPFDGKTYAENPSIPPAREMTETPKDQILIGR